MTFTIADEKEFSELREALQGSRVANSFICKNIPYERLRVALLDVELTDVDRLVRLRHALRYASVHSSELNSQRSLPVNRLLPNGLPPGLYAYGLTIKAGGWIAALPWRPEWLESQETNDVDTFAMGEYERPWRKTEIAADPWLTQHFAMATYRGAGQASAIRSALNMPRGQTLFVLLPTGEGKSLVFQTLAEYNPGQTVLVVVPTVALAQGHAASIQLTTSLGDHEFAYLGGREEENLLIRERILNGTQRLVFAAPEAVVTSLRGVITEAARLGKLTAIVVDEAHIVDSWGTDFRCEFQMLSALMFQTRLEAPESSKPNIVCLSATVTPMSYETLRALFSVETSPGISGSIRLRPEPDIWIDRSWSDVETRRKRVVEAVRNLPRPAILYVTRPDDAEEWYKNLREIGFGRIERLHGGTSTADKERVVKKWCSGELDLVVGTSAFGLGIDFPNVRAVIHACLPENIDRYYQEIGRAGRDNRSCIALLIPTPSDQSIARSQSNQIIISIEKGLVRWQSMFDTKVRPDGKLSRYVLDLETPPKYDQDMHNGKNEDWNAQTLSLMARAGLIKLTGLPSRSEQKHTITIDINDKEEAHSKLETWHRLVEPLRQRILANNQRGFVRMLELVNSRNCPATIFSEAYRINTDLPVTAACGGCEYCRRKTPGWFADSPPPPHPPWALGNFAMTHFNFPDRASLFIERNELTKTRTAQRQVKELVSKLWKSGIRKCIIVGEVDSDFIKELANQPWCVAQSDVPFILIANGLPDGPELVWIERSAYLSARDIDQIVLENERIYLLPHRCEDPRNPGAPLSERKAVYTVSEILNRIEQ
jgi:ATP-dependent DNA helicase RecQ